MAISDFQTIMLPLLSFSGDSKEHSIWEAVDFLATEFQLSDEELRELLPSGQQETFANRVNWAKTYLKKAGLIHSTRGGSEVSKKAREYTQKIDIKIILIDGDQLAQMLIDYNVGVGVVQTYEIKRLDSDYFEVG